MDRIIDAMAQANWTVLLTIIIGLIIWVIAETYKKDKLSEQMKNLSLEFLKKQEELENKLASIIDSKHNNLGYKVSGKYNNLGSQISTEHKLIKSDTKNVYEMLMLEKQNREKLYENSSRAREILDTIDVMKEVVEQNAILNQQVSNLKVENKELQKVPKNNYALLIREIRTFESQLANFEEYGQTEEIIGVLKQITNQLSQYID